MKRIASLVLAVILTVGMATAAFAANPKITSQTAALADIDVGEKGPGYQIWIPLKKEAFSEATEDLTMSDVRTSNIEVKKTNKTGSKAIQSVEIKDHNKVASILVTLDENYTSTKELDFEVVVYLTIKNKKQGFSTVVSGSLCNDTESIYSDTDYVDLSDGITALCEETTSQKVESYIGEGISVFVRMTKNKEYYGKVSREISEDDFDILDKNPEIEEIYTLSTINLNATGDVVQINYPTLAYVYSKSLQYLGTTDDMLPYSTKYYIANAKLGTLLSDIEDEDEPEDEPEFEYEDESEYEDEPEFEPETTVTASSSQKSDYLAAVTPTGTNTGRNPDTGAAEPFVGVAAAVALASLAVLAAAGMKKKR